jgi:UDP:flavonoid glycosyltransferase YjiC (YdhE family)
MPFAVLTSHTLALAIRAALDEPRHGERARELARRVKDEDGCGAVEQRLERLTA